MQLETYETILEGLHKIESSNEPSRKGMIRSKSDGNHTPAAKPGESRMSMQSPHEAKDNVLNSWDYDFLHKAFREL